MTWPRPAAPPRQQAQRRYGWWRCYSDFTSHPKWRVVAVKAAVPVHQVVAIATAMLCKANVAHPRGSLAEFSILECGAALDIQPDNVARVFAALEELGWIDQDYLTTWDKRQPDKEDLTATERQRRRREKKRQERLSTQEGCHGVTGVTQRDVTPRPDQASKKEGLGDWHPGGAAAAVHTDSGGIGDDAGQIEVWLALEGRRIVTERLQVNTTLAQVRMANWRKELDDDAAALAEIIRGADQADYVGARFHNLIVDHIKRRRHQANGPQLPLPPASVKGRRTG